MGLFATVDTNPLGADGLFYGGGSACWASRHSRSSAVIAYTFVVTADHRVPHQPGDQDAGPAEEEDEGLDYALHGETAYEFTTLGGSVGAAADVRCGAGSGAP